MTIRTFPTGFLWGASTAGHQVEGGNTTSDTWFLEHVTPTVFKEPSGRACDSWARWREDVDYVASLGLTAYRFSVEWARVEPSRGAFDDDALTRYGDMARHCRALGLAPVVTFNHFTAPHWFAREGAWLDAASAERFARYCDRVMSELGGEIAYALTLNEPNLPRLLTWIHLPSFVRDLERATLDAASRAEGVERYRTGNVVLPEDFDAMQAGLSAAHVAGKEAIKAQRADLPVGLSIAIVDDLVVGADTSVRDRKRAEVYEHWLALAAADDFVGVQNYERAAYDGNGEVALDASLPRNRMGSPVVPGSLAGAVRYAHARTGVPVLVTEHGVGTDDDDVRAAYVPASLVELHDVIGEGVPVLGYMHWSLLDNFEWIFGYDIHFGLVAVDRTTFARSPKPSAAVLGSIARSNAVDDK